MSAPTARPRRILTAVALLASAALALSGCLYAQIPAETSSKPIPTSTETPDSLDGYYEQQVQWASCASGFDCATVRVPLDYDKPGERAIDIAITRSKATGSNRLGSLLVNPGGPGASGIDFVQGDPDYAVGAKLHKSYDVIGFDPRGVGKSTAVACLDPKQMDAYLYDIAPGERGSAEWTAAVDAGNKTFADACEQNSNGILPYITTKNSARDMDIIRAVVGDEQLHYLGYSYGTFLGATYAELFPDKVGRLVLDGAIDPSVSSSEVSTEQGIGFENALRAYMAYCLGSSSCPFRGTVDQAMSDLGALLADLSARPLKNSDGRELGADAMLTAIIVTLYSQDSWSALTKGLTQALNGDPTYPFFLADYYNSRSSDGTYTDNSSAAFRAYNCMDYPLDDSQAALDAQQATLAAKAPTVAPYWSGPDPCEQWPYEPTGTRGPITADGAAPIVVVGTTGDPATPYQWSVALAKQLSSGVLVTHKGEGHTGYNKGDPCVDNAVVSYFTDGTVPTDGSCG
ncbi:alpha/beta hydrolase [uncultured Microbacterium sp.]|uniref:alpha/beta hydrolase n=1 Tax=uncultured Microbacterium sp. TaxID=191216 RepID=UPI0025CC4E6C|nr:alpha/beta hydrolase [uncultured Microbacterium sp.]